MPRTPRIVEGGLVYHVLNRAHGGRTLFASDGDHVAFERAMAETAAQVPVRLLAYCLMPNHWHLVLWPEEKGALSEHVRRLTLKHVQRFQAHHASTGTGGLYQGRFKSFPVQDDAHLLTVLRYVERNPVRAGLVRRAQDWRWGSAWRRAAGGPEAMRLLSQGPLDLPADWLDWVDRAETPQEIEALRQAARRGRPFGDDAWAVATARRLGLEPTLRPPGRPRRAEVAGA